MLESQHVGRRHLHLYIAEYGSVYLEKIVEQNKIRIWTSRKDVTM